MKTINFNGSLQSKTRASLEHDVNSIELDIEMWDNLEFF